MRNPNAGMLRSFFALIALLATAGVHAQAQTSISVQAATNVFNQILGVSFAAGSTTVLNTDEASLHRLESLTFVTNPNTFFVDLLAADDGGKILRYATDFTCQPPQSCTTGTVVSQAAAIGNPNGLSADPFGNVFAVNNAPGISPQPQVWALPTAGNGGYLQAVNIDTTSPTGSLGQHQAVVETMIVRTPLGTSQFTLTSAPFGPGYTGGTLMAAWPNFTGTNYQVTLSTGQSITACTFTNGSTTFTCPSTNINGTPNAMVNVPLLNAGDLLVVSQAPDEILLYPGHAGAGPLSPNYTPTVLIPQCPVQPVCIPAGSTPGGIAVWPADNSLLVTTFGGSILRFEISGGTITQGQPVSGLPAGNLYKINSALANGGPVAYVAQSAPGNHGSILELTPFGNNGIQFFASVTAPGSVQGIAATNTAQAPEGNCLAVNGGCDLFGDKLNKHTIMPIPGGPKLAASNIVETLCFVAQDPRVSSGGVFNNQPLKVNDVCPGFDDTNGVNPMIIPGFFRGGSGISGSAFAMIKTQTANDQFNATYVHTEQDPNALFPNASNPVCGANGGTAVVLWGPRAGEGLIAEENVNIVNPGNANPMPTLVDIGDGCGTGTGGTHQVSIFASGLELALQGGNTPANLEAFVQQKYTNLLTTITELSGGQNVSAAVASQLTNNNGTGCVDLSLSLFNKAMGEIPPQQTADFQDAADLLTNADTTGTTTCDSIVTTNAYVPGAFQETLSPLPPAAPVYNPSGQLRARFANISNAITMRILNEAPASIWPTPLALSVSPQYMFGQCLAPGCPPQQNPSAATLSWALVNGANHCTWTGTTDPNFKPSPPKPDPLATPSVKVGPFTAPPPGSPAPTDTYTLTCNVPAGTMPAGGGTMSVSTYLTVWPAIAVTTSPQSVVAGQSVQVNWTPPAGATACTLTFSGQGSFNSGSTTFVPGPTTGTSYGASYLASVHDVSKGVTFAATCTAGASAGVASITVTHH